MKTKSANRTFDLGPGSIAMSPLDANVRFLIFGNYDMAIQTNKVAPEFVLSSEEWFTIQRYVAKVLGLPNTEEKFKTYLGSGAQKDLSDFTKLVKAYDTMNKHVTQWQDDTFPSSVSLASDIYNFSLKVETYFAPILPLAKMLEKDPGNQEAKNKLVAILSVLSTSARDHQAKAAVVAGEIKDFANRTLKDKIELSGSDDKSGLSKYYIDKYGEASGRAKELVKLIAAQQKIIDDATKEYEHDVVVASTTPTYCWVGGLLGLVAASVVAGVYGKKAVGALGTIHAAQEKIHELQAEEQANANLLTILTTTTVGMADIVKAVNAALPLIQKIQGTWQSIADDLDAIVKIIQEDIAKAVPILMDLGVENAIKAWKAVGHTADKYRQNAYISIQPS